jgi:hypothetical protein
VVAGTPRRAVLAHLGVDGMDGLGGLVHGFIFFFWFSHMGIVSAYENVDFCIWA